jgi:hypothetical protein
VQQLTRHAEVNQENATSFESDNYILATALERGDPLSHELGSDLGWIVGPRQAGVCDLDVDEPAPDQLRLELRPDRLDLG